MNRDNFMKNRLSYSAFVIFILFALLKNQAIGLGLGEIEVKSALNQPFDATIKLSNTNGLTEEEIVVNLASKKDFERIGIDRLFLLLDLKFGIYIESDSAGVIHVTTKEPIDEPYLDFVVETQWPTGRLLREYTVLIDPPVFVDAPVAVAEVPVATGQTAPQKVAPSSQAVQTSSAVGSGNQGSLTTENGYIKTTDETLWEVALKARPSSDYSVQQTMLAIQDQNPRAFMRGNINLIKQHQKIKVPTPEQIRSRSFKQANNEVAFQNKAFAEGRRLPSNPQKMPLIATDTTASESGKAGASDGQAELTLVSDEGMNTEQTTGGLEEGASDSTSPETLKNALAISEENLDKSKQENLDLSARLAALETNLETMQKLLTLKDEQMALLQTELENPEVGAATGESIAEETIVEVGSSVDDVSAADTQEVVSVDDEPTKESDQATTATSPTESDSIIAQIKDNVYFWVAGLALILLILFFVFRSKGKEDDDTSEFGSFDSDTPLTDDDFNQDGLEDISGFEEADDFNDDIIADEPGTEQTASGFVETKDEVKAETSDVIAEADIYLAYGRAQPAIDILASAIQTEPNRTDLRVKLLEVYADQNDNAAFDQGLAELAELGDDDANQQAAELRTRMVVDDEPSGDTDNLVFDMLASDESAAETEENAGLAAFSVDQAETAPVISSLEKSISEHESRDEQEIGEIDFEIDMDDFEIDTNDEPLTDFDIASGSDSAADADVYDEDDADLDSINMEMRLEAEAIVARLQDQDLITELDEETTEPTLDISIDNELDSAESSQVSVGTEENGLDDVDMESPLGVDESETKIDLARAYIEMEDFEGAQELLKEVIQEGSADQKTTAEQLIADIG